jgi:predicted dithiol-disulfide oxidoreductase (DUF899 family)
MTMQKNAVVSEKEWVEARRALLAKEKEFTRLRDALTEQRRALPWVAVTKEYPFEGPSGAATLPDLFDGRSQLVVYHFMFDPSWEAGCPICSFWADNFDGVVTHLAHRDVTMVAISQAPYAKLAAYEKRMGWRFRWYSSAKSDFNRDFHVTFTPEELSAKKADYNFVQQDPRRPQREGISVLYRDDSGAVFRTYSTYARGLDLMNTAYNYLDLVPKGRDEAGKGPSWVRRHDEYDR